jgi:hypothetical protein
MLEEVDFMAARKFLKYSGSGVGVSRLRGTELFIGHLVA